ncbi:hypothetical protein SESBI_03849 [Sesbania bispinosa]|nr:hypothetical protein SESBI_03849 [Sesbania bispinosa]
MGNHLEESVNSCLLYFKKPSENFHLTLFRFWGDVLTSPLHDSLLYLIRKEKVLRTVDLM